MSMHHASVSMEMDNPYLEILRMIERGTISAEEGEMLLDALDAGSRPEDEPGYATIAQSPEAKAASDAWSPGQPAWAGQAWAYLLAGGAVLVGLTGIIMLLLVAGAIRLGWLACALAPMIFGALVIAVAWWSRSARWLHVRVRDQDTRFRVSLPVPLRPAAWLARLARPWVPQMRDLPVDELILGLADMEEKDVLAVDVSDKGEEVQIYLG